MPARHAQVVELRGALQRQKLLQRGLRRRQFIRPLLQRRQADQQLAILRRLRQQHIRLLDPFFESLKFLQHLLVALAQLALARRLRQQRRVKSQRLVLFSQLRQHAGLIPLQIHALRMLCAQLRQMLAQPRDVFVLAESGFDLRQHLALDPRTLAGAHERAAHGL